MVLPPGPIINRLRQNLPGWSSGAATYRDLLTEPRHGLTNNRGCELGGKGDPETASVPLAHAVYETMMGFIRFPASGDSAAWQLLGRAWQQLAQDAIDASKIKQ